MAPSLATATVSNESTSGWQQALFSAPVADADQHDLHRVLHCPNGRYSYTSGGLELANRAQPTQVSRPMAADTPMGVPHRYRIVG